MRAGEVEPLYVVGNHATPRHVDFVCGTGLFPSLWFDLEHFDIPTQELAVLNMVARAYPVTTIARFKAAGLNVRDTEALVRGGGERPRAAAAGRENSP